jgi:ATP-dependent helicase HrpB
MAIYYCSEIYLAHLILYELEFKLMSHAFPIDKELPALHAAMASTRRIILSAPPGAGKTTRVPPSLLECEWLNGRKIIMLEPRRLAARRAAEFMAGQMGERVGATVGFRVRGDAKVSAQTRIEVVTEGILTRMLHADPALEDAALIIFDEFHERSIHADLGLALTLDVQNNLRDDLKILVMSATLDTVSLAALLEDAAIVRSEGKSYDVDTRYLRFIPTKSREAVTADAVAAAAKEEEGDMLVFLPGRREIRFVENILHERRLPDDVRVHTLYGDAPYEQQQAALTPAPDGARKVILSTSVAETSLTIDGVRIVIDSGQVRMAEFDPRRGMSGLITVPVSKATADQRRGRAGRQQPGICYRMWTEAEHAQLPDHPQPEIKNADLASLALDLAAWGEPTGDRLKFIDPPPAHHLAQARTLLGILGALDAQGSITRHGKLMTDLPVHPRIAHMIIRGNEIGSPRAACLIAALLEERDLFSGRSDADVDLAVRLHAVMQQRNANRFALERVLAQADRLFASIERSGKRNKSVVNDEHAGLLLALAYPDRIARRRGGEGSKYLTANGTTAILPAGSLLRREEYLAIGETDTTGTDPRILLAAPLARLDIDRYMQDAITSEEQIEWNSRDEAVIARRVSRLGAMILDEQPITTVTAAVGQAMLTGIRSLGLEVLPWTKEVRALCLRSEWARAHCDDAAGFPAMDNIGLLESIEEWLAPFLSGMRRRAQLASLDLDTILKTRLGYDNLRLLDRLAPSHLPLPSGSHIAVNYSTHPPVLAVKLQELFGQTETPGIGNGRAPLLLHILSPAQRPLAVTQDLRSFWATVYPEIRTQMRAKYPRHVWPDDPLTAQPTNKTKRRQIHTSPK